MVRILIDSSADYTLPELAERNIELLPIHITLGEREYLDTVELERDRLYEMLADTGEFPKTAQTGIFEFERIFAGVRDAGDEMVCILLSSALSGTCNSARLAKESVGYEKIYIVDSLSATVVNQLLGDLAAARRDAGVSADRIAAELEQRKGRLKVLACPDTLDYLSRGGRLNKTTAALGNTLHLKPVITVTDDGRVEMIDKQIGLLRAMHAIIRRLQKNGVDPEFPVYTIYSYGTENCARFEQELAAAGIAPTARKQIGATIGSHIGPGAFGVVYAENCR